MSILFAGGCGSAPPPAASPVSLTLPIHAGQGHIVHEVWLGGEGPFWCILDTGNAQTIVFDRVARQLSLAIEPLGEMGGAGPGTIQVQATKDLAVALRGDNGEEISFVEPTTIVLPDSATLPDFEGRRIDAFLGASLIERYATTVDYAGGQLRLQDRASFRPGPGAKEMVIELTDGFPHFTGRVVARRDGADVDPIEGQFLLDLGAAYAVQVDFEFANARGLLDESNDELRAEGQIMGIDGVLMDLLSVPAGSVAMGGCELQVPRVLLLPVTGGGPPIEGLVGNVGSGCFRNGALTLDYPGRRLVFEPAR